MGRRPVQALYQAVSGDAGDAFAPTARVKGNVALGLIPLVARQGSFAMLQALHQATLAEKKPAAYGWLGPQMVVYVQDPKPVFSVADSNATRAGPDTRGPFGGLERIFGDNILTLTGPSWKLHRAFVKSRLTSAQAVEEAYRLQHNVIHALRSLLPGGSMTACDPTEKRVQEEILHLVRERVLKPNAWAVHGDPGCLLHKLWQAISPDDFLSEAMVGATTVLLFASHETTATTLSSALIELHRQPRVYDELTRELDALVVDPTWAQLNACPYLDAVVRETLRCFPFVAEIGRYALRDFDLNVGEHTLPLKKGTLILGSPFLFQTQSNAWPEEGASFKPERFLGVAPQLTVNGVSGREKTFGQGPHMCLGFRLGVMEIKVFLATLLIGRGVHVLNEAAAELDTTRSMLKRAGSVQVIFTPRPPRST
ncbi:hypothetical protein NCC49_005695 [Naganishia albida]|nr:hypothetical protein NCC49_005695 [Naganishia albida]